MPVVLSTEPRDALAAVLEVVGPKAGVTAGNPVDETVRKVYVLVSS